MKKYLLSFGLVIAFALYIALSNQGSSSVDPSRGGSVAVARDTNAGAGATPAPTSAPSPAPAPAPANGNGAPAPSPAPAPQPTPASGAYKNGSYTGPVADAFYGPVQVEAVISGGQLSDVKILQYPNGAGHSQEVSAYSLPQLVQEAIQAQSANVDIVSGATQTSGAFAQSLAAALAQAKS